MLLMDRDDSGFSPLRLQLARDCPVNPSGAFVVYWMTAARRVHWNFALQRAADWAAELKRPLVVVEVLACGGRWDCDRFHRFTLEGMTDNARQLAGHAALYYPFMESQPGESGELFAALSKQACAIVMDDFPIALPAIAAIEPHCNPHCNVRLEKVDGNGLLPMRAADRAFPTAAGFRRFLQKTLREHIFDTPAANPLARKKLPRLESLPGEISRRWPAIDADDLKNGKVDLSALPIDRSIGAVEEKGGSVAAEKAWKRFLQTKLARYGEDRNQPETAGASGLSAYLHFGHISVHEILHDLIVHESWTPAALAEKATGCREGWWGMRAAAESFLDEIVTWREVGFNGCTFREDFDRYESLPDWAQTTLSKHAGDKRPSLYTLDRFAAAATHDPLWNAAQRQLLREGRIHNYLRMLWGKKILEWSPSPQIALDNLIELNNRYAIDGQDPNSYSGIFWILGRYDRPWGPERPIFGLIRYMSSENTARKLRVKEYLQVYGSEKGMLRF